MGNIRFTRYGTASPRVSQPEARVEIFEPTLGFDGGQAPQELDKGYTPESQNFVRDGGYIKPRSGLSRYDATYSLGGAGLFGMEAFDVSGLRYGMVASDKTVGVFGPNSQSFANLTYTGTTEAPDASTAIAWDGAFIYDSTRDKNIAVLTEAQHLPKYAVLQSDMTQYSDFTYSSSAFSHARSVCAFDNRLIWFNTSSAVSNFPQRVEYSARGTPTDYTTANGAGFDDLMDMRGIGQKIVAEQDGMVLFTDMEIWRARKRGDNYVFDYYPVNKTMGCPYPRTIAQTPQGIVFVGRDLEVYLLSGTELIPLGPTNRKAPEQGDASRIQRYLTDNIINGALAFGVYNTKNRRYELYYATSGLYPSRALYLDFNNMSWFQQKFDLGELSGGFEMQDVDAATTWDSVSYTWDQYNVTWDTAGLTAPTRSVVLLSSSGTPYRPVSTQTNDDGTAVDARWRSHGLNQSDQFRYDEMYEVWTEYTNASNSSASIWITDNLGASFLDSIAVNLSASSHSVVMAPVWMTAQAPQFEIRINDGGQPKISRLQAYLRDGGRWAGGL